MSGISWDNKIRFLPFWSDPNSVHPNNLRRNFYPLSSGRNKLGIGLRPSSSPINLSQMQGSTFRVAGSSPDQLKWSIKLESCIPTIKFHYDLRSINLKLGLSVRYNFLLNTTTCQTTRVDSAWDTSKGEGLIVSSRPATIITRDDL